MMIETTLKLAAGIGLAAMMGGSAIERPTDTTEATQLVAEWPDVIAEDVPTPEPDPKPNKPESYRPAPAAVTCDCDCLTEAEVEAIAERVCKAFHAKMAASKPTSGGSTGNVVASNGSTGGSVSSGSTGGAVTVSSPVTYSQPRTPVRSTVQRVFQAPQRVATGVRRYVTSTGCTAEVTVYSDGTQSAPRLISCPLQRRR